MKYRISYENVDRVITKIVPASSQDLFSRDTIIEAEEGLIKDILADAKLEYYYKEGKVLSRPKGTSFVSKIKQLAREEWNLSKTKSPEFVLKKALREGLSFEEASKMLLQSENQYETTKKNLVKLRLEYQKKELEAIAEVVKKRKEKNEKQQVYHSVIVAIAKNETEYLFEWIKHHLDLGIEHIFIHDDNSSEPIKTTVSKLPARYRDKISVYGDRLTHPYSVQRLFYSNWLREWEHKVKWVSFLDIDEFVNLKGKSIKDFLSKFEQNEKVGEVNFNWIVYNANGQRKKRKKPLRERFKQVSPVTLHKKGLWLGKFFARPYAIEGIRIHECILSKGLNRVTPDGYPVVVARPNIKIAYLDPQKQSAFIEHYYTKSLKEWQAKMNRGAVDYYLKHFEEFYAHNPDMKKVRKVKGYQVYKES